MDNLRTLFDKKEYELIIKLTKESSDPDDLFYCISAYLCLNKTLEALDLINSKHKMLETRLPMLMKVHIEVLCMLFRFDDAYRQIDIYQNYPYHSQEAEEVLRSLRDVVRDYERNIASNHKMDEEEIIKALMSKESDIVLGALDALRDKDVNLYYIYLSKILSSFPKQAIRSFALLLLVYKKVNLEYNFLSSKGMIRVNPSELNPPFMGDEYNSLLERMQETYKDSSVCENAIQILSTYLIYIYPQEIDYNDPNLLEALKIKASNYLNIPYKSDKEKECKELLDAFDIALNDM